MPRPRPFNHARPARAVAAITDLTPRRARSWPSSRTSCWTPTPTRRNSSTTSHTTPPGQHTSTIYARCSARVAKCSHAPPSRNSRLAVGTTWRRSMFVELDTRHGDGLTVTLEWDRDTGHTQIVVHDARCDGLIAFIVPPVSAAAMNASDRRAASSVAAASFGVQRGNVRSEGKVADLCLRMQEYRPRGGHVGGVTPSRPHREGYRAGEKDR